jgi:putative toxin-antitoxin system antitoxin component (TIGR02293 family)
MTQAATMAFKDVKRIISRAGISTNEMPAILGISIKTFERRIQQGRLDAAETHRLEFIAQTLELAEKMLGDKVRARLFLHEPLAALNGKTPLELLTNMAGYEKVRDSLVAQAFGQY